MAEPVAALRAQLSLDSATFERGARRASASMGRLRRDAQATSGGFAGLNRALRGPGIRNASLQLSQVAQQASATGDPLRALAIQLPDLTLGFGPLGIAAGVAAGALLPFAANLFRTKVSAEDAEKAVDAFSKAVDTYVNSARIALTSVEDLREEFGRFAEDIQASAEVAGRAAAQNAVTAFTETATALEGQFASILEINDRLREQTQEVAIRSIEFPDLNLEGAVAELDRLRAEARDAAAEIGLSVAEVDRLSNAFDTFSGARTFDEIVSAAGQVLEEIDRISGASGEIPVALRPAAAALSEIQRSAASAADASEELAAGMEGAEGAAVGLSSVAFSNITSGADEAARLANNLRTALSELGGVAGERAVRAGVSNGSIPPEALADIGNDAVYDFNNERAIADRIASRQRATRGSSGGGGGGAPELSIEAQIVEGAIRQAERAAADFGQIQEILRQQMSSGRIGLEEYEFALEDLTEQFANSGTGALEAFESQIKSISRTLADAIVSGEDLGEAMRQIFQQIASDLLASGIEQLLLSAFAPLSGGASRGGGFFSAIFPSFSGGGFTGFGSRSGGIDGQGGFPAILHPNEFVTDLTARNMSAPRDSGGTTVNVINNSGQDVQTNRSTGPGGQEIIDVMIGQSFSSGRQDATMKRFGAGPQAKRRG